MAPPPRLELGSGGSSSERELGQEKTSVTHETWTTRARVTEHSQRGLSHGANAYLVPPWSWLASLDAMMSPRTERALIVVDSSRALKYKGGAGCEVDTEAKLARFPPEDHTLLPQTSGRIWGIHKS